MTDNKDLIRQMCMCKNKNNHAHLENPFYTENTTYKFIKR